MRKFLILSFTNNLNPRGNNLNTYLTLQAEVYYNRLKSYGFDTYIYSPNGLEGKDCVSEVHLGDYTDIVVLYIRANFFHGEMTGAKRYIYEDISKNGFPNVDSLRWWFFYDDQKNPPENLGHRYLLKRESGYFEDCPLIFEEVSRKLEISMTGPNSYLLVPGGDIAYSLTKKYSLGIPQEKHINDEWQNYKVAKLMELCGSSGLTPQKKYDVMYAGIARKGRVEVLLPIFKSKDLETVSYMTNNYEIRKNFVPHMNSFNNHTFGHKFKLLDSEYRHAESWTHIIVGDKWQWGRFKSLRFYQSLKFNSIPLIYIGYDPEKKFIRNPLVKTYCYFETMGDIMKLVYLLKTDKGLYTSLNFYTSTDEYPTVPEFKFEL